MTVRQTTTMTSQAKGGSRSSRPASEEGAMRPSIMDRSGSGGGLGFVQERRDLGGFEGFLVEELFGEQPHRLAVALDQIAGRVVAAHDHAPDLFVNPLRG